MTISFLPALGAPGAELFEGGGTALGSPEEEHSLLSSARSKRLASVHQNLRIWENGTFPKVPPRADHPSVKFEN